MKILFLTDNFPPEANAPATRTFEHCREWVTLGADVTVITCAPNFPAGQVYPGYRNRWFQREEMEGIKVHRVWSYMAPNAGFSKRILDYLSFAGSSFIAGLFVSADVVVATSPQFFTTLSGLALSIIKRRPWVFELRDLWPDSIRAVSAMENQGVLDQLEKLELFLYKHTDLVVALTPAFERNLRKRGIARTPIEVVTNGVDLSMFDRQPPDRELVDRLGLQGKFVVGYIGTHGLAHDLEGLLGASDKCPSPDVTFMSIGAGARKQALADATRGRSNVLLLDPVPKQEIVRYWSVIDVALVPLRRDPAFQSVIPSKIFEAAAMGKPILLGVEGQAKEIVDEYGAGLCFEPQNADDFLAKVEQLRSDRVLYERLRAGCARLAADYDRRALAHRMYDHLRALSGQPR